MKNAITVALILLLAGCATPYRKAENANDTGFSDLDGPGKLTTVQFRAIGIIPNWKLQRYTLLRCADIANDHHKPYFIIYATLTDAANGRAAEQPFFEWSEFTGARSIAYMIMLDAKTDGAISTEETLRYLSSFKSES